MAQSVRITLTKPMIEALDFIKNETSPLLKYNEIIKNALSEYYANTLKRTWKKRDLVNISENWEYRVTKEESERIRKSYEDAQKEENLTKAMTANEFMDYLKN